MKILIYGLHFKPDLIGIGKYTGEMVDWLFHYKYNVRVITAPHFYPEWKLGKRLWYYKKENNPYIVWRCPIYVPKQPSGLNRILHSFSFALSSIPIILRNIFWKPDAIITIEPSFFTAPFTLIYSYLTKTKSILHIQDLEIDAAFNLNILKKGIFFNLIKRFEKLILNRFDIITTISPMMKKMIICKGIKKENIHVLPNWAETDTINPTVKSNYLRKSFSIESKKKIILYSGNIGEKQNLDIVIDVAEKMSTIDDRYIFLIVGDGAAKQRLVKQVNDRNINNIFFKPLVANKDLGALLTMADIHLITQDKNISDLVLPSKLTNILSAGGISIISAKPDTQLSQIVDKYNIGYLIAPNSTDELLKAIDTLIENKTLGKNISNNARKYAEKYLSINTILSNFTNQVLNK